MSVPGNCQLLVGLPETGKTTFLAALWYALNHRKEADGLIVEALPEDQRYLNEISRIWQAGKIQPRTRTGGLFRVSLSLTDPATGNRAKVVLPDLSGESFRQDQWRDRHWTEEYDSLARGAVGVLLFINPANWSDAIRIPDIVRAETIIEGAEKHLATDTESCEGGPGGEDACRDGPDAVGKVTPFDPLNSPSQVILVDLLQFVVGEPCFHRSLRVSVIISAWDLIEGCKRIPKDCLALEMSLLSQYLAANNDVLEWRLFGVSAQGGSYKDEEVKRRLLAKSDPTERVKVVDGDGNASEITAPIQWQMTAY